MTPRQPLPLLQLPLLPGGGAPAGANLLPPTLGHAARHGPLKSCSLHRLEDLQAYLRQCDDQNYLRHYIKVGAAYCTWCTGASGARLGTQLARRGSKGACGRMGGMQAAWPGRGRGCSRTNGISSCGVRQQALGTAPVGSASGQRLFDLPQGRLSLFPCCFLVRVLRTGPGRLLAFHAYPTSLERKPRGQAPAFAHASRSPEPKPKPKPKPGTPLTAHIRTLQTLVRTHPLPRQVLTSMPHDLLVELKVKLKARSAWLSGEEQREYKRAKLLNVMGSPCAAPSPLRGADADAFCEEVLAGCGGSPPRDATAGAAGAAVAPPLERLEMQLDLRHSFATPAEAPKARPRANVGPCISDPGVAAAGTWAAAACAGARGRQAGEQSLQLICTVCVLSLCALLRSRCRQQEIAAVGIELHQRAFSLPPGQAPSSCCLVNASCARVCRLA